MKNLKAGLSVFAAAILLTGCGGGGGNSSSSEQAVQLPAAVTADYAYIADDGNFLSVKTIRYVNGGTGQVQYGTTLGPDSFLLSPSTLYNNTWVNMETRAQSPEILTFSEVPGHLRTEYLKKVDISGKDIFATVYPGIREFYNYLAQKNTLNTAAPIVQASLKPVHSFPAGSTCYVTDRTESKQGYIRFERADLDTDASYQEISEILEDWVKDTAAAEQWTYKISSGNWGGHEWKYVQFFDQYNILRDDFTVVNDQGNAYYGEMYDFENFSAGAQITKVKALIADTPAQSEDYYWYSSVLKNYEQGCTYYNNTAAQALSLLK